MKSLTETSMRFSITLEKEIVKEIKEKIMICCVSLDFEGEIKSFETFDYELPDNTYVIAKD